MLGGGYDAYLYYNGTVKDLGTLGSYILADGINQSGQIVGYYNGGTSAFLYSGGVMKDLNNLVIGDSGWELQVATAINDSSQIVGWGINPAGQEHAFLLNPLAPGSVTAASAVQTSTPPYGNLPVREEGKDGLVVVTHGWSPTALTKDPVVYSSWIYDFSNILSERLENDGKIDWQAFAYSWATNSWTDFLGNALHAANAEGIRLGDSIATQGWTKVHLIGHSCGAELINAAAQEIKIIAPATVIQCTFLAPYLGGAYENLDVYGAFANWSDCYLDNDLTFGWTAQPVLFAYNANVTALNSAAEDLPSFGSGVDPFEPCYSEMTPSLAGHSWPIEFYTNTVANNTSAPNWSDYDGFGYGLAVENLGDDWAAQTSDFPPGNGVPFFGYGSVTTLGPQSPTCLSIIGGSIAHAASTVGFSVESTIESSASNVETTYGVASLIDGPPAWVATVVTPTNAVNQLSFDAEFTSASGAHGLLSVYWDTNLLGFIDEAEVQSGLQHHIMAFPIASAGTSHVLGFHLDPFALLSSSISMTNIMVGWAGVTQRPTLSVAGLTNGLIVFQLSGQEDNYEIQATTNLLSTNWIDVALIANTADTAEFTDQSSTNYLMRFYRAIAQ